MDLSREFTILGKVTFLGLVTILRMVTIIGKVTILEMVDFYHPKGWLLFFRSIESYVSTKIRTLKSVSLFVRPSVCYQVGHRAAYAAKNDRQGSQK